MNHLISLNNTQLINHQHSFQSYHPIDYQSSVHHNVYSPSSSIPQLEYAPSVNQQPKFSQPDSGLIALVFQRGDYPIDVINHVMSFLTAVVTSRYPTTNNQLRNSSNPRQQATINDGRCTKPKRKWDDSWFKEKVLLVQAQAHGQILNEEELAFLADLDIPEGQATQTAMPSSKQSNVMNHLETEITSDSNIIPYSQYVIESQQAAVQNSNSSAQQDALILSVIEQKKTQVVNCTKLNLDNKSVNDTLTTELERYKEQVKVLKEGQNVDLRSNDNVLDSCAQSVEIDRLKQTLSKHLKEKESLMQTVILLKNDFKKEESRNIDREIALEKRIKINSVNSLEPTLSSRPTKVEVPKELLKVSMVNTSLKKLKYHVAGFDVVVKERTIPTAITEGSWGFEHTKAYFRDEIIPFVKALKDLFNTFDQYLIDELSEVQNVFHQIEQAVEQHRLKYKTFEVKMNQVLNKNERLLEQVINKDIVNIIINSSVDIASVNMHESQFQEKDTVIKKLKERIKSLSGKINEDKIKKDLEEIETINIELDHRVLKLIAENEHLKQTYKQLYDSIKPARIRSKEQCDDLNNQVNINYVEISDLNASLQEKVLVITTLKDDLRKLKGKALVDNDVTKHSSDPEILKIDVEPITPKLYAKRIQELLTNISKTCPSINNADGKLVAVTPKNKDKRHSKINANSELLCVKCNGCMLSDIHDLCVLDFINDVNARAKSKSVKKSSKRKVWKLTGKVFTNIGYTWRPIGWTFTIVGNVCPLTRITTTVEVPLETNCSIKVKHAKPVVTLVYSRKPRKSKTNILVSKPMIVKSISANKRNPVNLGDP
ncbi:hypothetical protein Tco_1154363 [Tanacetum coccineum]